MNEQLFLNLQEQFDNYVDQFSFTDSKHQENIDLKHKHSYQVCKQMNKITKNILDNQETYIAKTIALLHDIGRFKQYYKYKTFADAKSEDHAQLGIKVLKESDFLAELDAETSQLILKAIQYHNKPYLPQHETEKCLLYTKLIRDADKLDIWRVVINEYKSTSNNKAVGLGLTDNDLISDAVYQSIINQEVVKYEDLKTLNDFKLLQMGWVYDINFSTTFAIIEEEEYIDQLYDFLPNNPQAKNIYSQIKSYLNKKTKKLTVTN